jgi:hypothetical protein
MQSLYFCLDHATPVLRYSSSIPRIGDTISLPELGGNLATLKVFDVIWEFGDNPRVNVLIRPWRRRNRWQKLFARLRLTLAIPARSKRDSHDREQSHASRP